MSSREPMWYCHECNAEMRPLMVPDPTCASCHGSFVEKMENPADDPREFQHQGLPNLGAEGLPPGIDNFLFALQGLMDHRGASGGPLNPQRNATSPPADRSRVTFQIRSSTGGPRTVTIGGPSVLSAGPGQGPIPTMSEYVGRGADMDGPTITGPIMAQYLMALLGHRDPLTEMFARGMGDGPSGQMGDYVFGQEALDQIITQLMENSNANRPVPATEEIIAKLPREVLEIGSLTLEKDCAVCKDQFNLETEDPGEQVVVTLPCKHPFHEGCILPWLKSSGTCPVCRYALVPQPEHHTPGSNPGGSSSPPRNPPSSSPPRSRSPRPRSPGREGDAGLFASLFGHLQGSNSGGGSSGNTTAPRSSNRSSNWPRPSDNSADHIPGSWSEDLD